MHLNKQVLTEIRGQMSEYDICIIGAGVSGLYCALELKKRFPGKSVVILERKAWLGGRIFTFHDEKRGLSWESGAGRVHKTHEMTLGLLKKYGLHTIPIPPEIDWRISVVSGL